MSRRNNMKKTYLTDEEAAHLSEWADEVGKSESTLIREAIREYLDHDRGDRIEALVKENRAMLEDIQTHLTSDAHTHTSEHEPVTRASETVEKARAIARRLENHADDGKVTADEVERAIKDIAGGDPRTVEKYEDELRQRGLAFEHPTVPKWHLDRDQFVADIASHVRQYQSPQGELMRIIDPYPIEFPDLMDYRAVVEVVTDE